MHPKNKWLLGAASAALISFVALWEGTETTPYKDIGGVLTVCNGTTEGIEDREYTLSECNEMTRKGLIRYGSNILECIDVPIPLGIYNSATSFSWNVGIQGACNSRFIKLVNMNKFYEACNALAYGPDGKPVWSFVKGKFIQGLHNRRLAERKMCIDGLSKFN